MPCLWLINKEHGSIDNLGRIMRRNAGRHADGDAACTICQQIGEQTGHNLGLFVFTIVGRAKVRCVLIKPVHELNRCARQTRFGISIRSGIIAVDVAKVALPVHQRVTQRKSLREPHHCVINGLVAMRVIFTDNIADNTGTFLIAARRIKLEQTHRPQQTPVYRFQPIAQIRKRPRGDC